MSRGQAGKKTGDKRGTTTRKRKGSGVPHQFFDKLLKRLAQPLTQVLLPKLTDQSVLEIKELDREITRIRSSESTWTTWLEYD